MPMCHRPGNEVRAYMNMELAVHHINCIRVLHKINRLYIVYSLILPPTRKSGRGTVIIKFYKTPLSSPDSFEIWSKSKVSSSSSGGLLSAAHRRKGVRAAAVRCSALSHGGLPPAGRSPSLAQAGLVGDLVQLADRWLEQGGYRSGGERPRRWREPERRRQDPPENRSASAVLVAAAPKRGGATVPPRTSSSPLLSPLLSRSHLRDHLV
jgi:hypothetical protein